LILDTYNPLTPFWTALTIGVELGLGVVAYIGAIYVVPFLRRRSSLIDFGEAREVDSLLRSSLGKFFLKKILRLKRIRKLPVNPIWFLMYYMGALGLAFLTLFIVTFDLVTSVGWISPFSLNGLEYDLIFARANGQPNGAHIVSYLGVVAIAWIVAVKYRDGPFPELFLGGLTGAFLVAIHEGIYIPFYYIQYAQYLDWSLLTNVLKDISMFSEMVLFIFAFKNYPFQKMNLKMFTLPAFFFAAYCVDWFFVPILFGYSPFPITIINNFKYGKTVYMETAYWADPAVNAIEVVSWVFAFLLMAIAIMGGKKKE